MYVEKPIEEINISKKQYKAIKTKMKQLSDEHAMLKNLINKISLTTEQKLDFAKKLDAMNYPIHMICRILSLRRSTYYHCKLRKPDITLIEENDQEFKPVIKRLFDFTEGRLGARKIRSLMMKEGYQISERRVKRLMVEMNLIPNKPDDDYKNYHKRKYAYKPTIISKSEHYPEPNKIWVSDITYIRVRKEHYYLFVIIDLYSRKVIGYKLSKSLEATELVELMKSSYRARKKPESLIFHSDQGLQYTSKIYKNYLKKHKITQSFSKKGCPYDNSVAESFFASLKKEEIYRHIYNSFDHLEKAIDEYIVFYNTVRPHGSLSNRTPEEFDEDGLIKAKENRQN
ncbi:MAG: IS3 family transposase [Bacillota bacterium]